MTEVFPVKYVLMRTDLPTMNPGKGMAQADHNGAAFVYDMLTQKFPNTEANERNHALYEMWRNSTSQNFGTVLTLGVNEAQMRASVEVAQKLFLVSGIIHDPSYPILVAPELAKALETDLNPDTKIQIGDGYHYVTIPLDTCAYIFGDKNDPALQAVVGNFGRYSLHP